MTIKKIIILLVLIFSANLPFNGIANNETTYDEESFIVKNIDVFSDSGNFTDSKKIALTNATNDALAIVLKRLISIKANHKLENLVKGDNSNLVFKYSIIKERITSHSYSATINIKFNRSSIKDLLIKNGIIFSEKLYSDCLLIPFIAKEQKKWAWKAWRQPSILRFGMVMPVVIDYNLDEMENLDFQTIMEKPYSFFQELLAYYNVKDILLINVIEEEENTFLRLKLLRPKDTYYKNMAYESIITEEKIDTEKRIITDILQSLDTWWKGDKEIFHSETSKALN